MIKIYNILIKHFGPQGWWPTINQKTGKCEYHKNNYEIPQTEQQKLQIVLGAILTQNTSWSNVEKSLINLNQNNLINIDKISSFPQEKLAKIIRSSGYHNQKAERLKIFCSHIIKHHININNFLSQDLEELRVELLSIKGIGPETADSIILYAGQKPVFVIDAYTKRIFSRLGLCNKYISYDGLQSLFHKELKKDVKLFNEFHALLVEHAKTFCKKQPLCSNCLLNKICEKRIE